MCGPKMAEESSCCSKSRDPNTVQIPCGTTQSTLHKPASGIKSCCSDLEDSPAASANLDDDTASQKDLKDSSPGTTPETSRQINKFCCSKPSIPFSAPEGETADGGDAAQRINSADVSTAMDDTGPQGRTM